MPTGSTQRAAVRRVEAPDRVRGSEYRAARKSGTELRSDTLAENERERHAETSQEHSKEHYKEPGLKICHGPIDMVFFTIVIVLLAYGIIMMFSASYVAGLSLEHPDGFHYVRTQAFAAVLGILLMIFISRWDYHVLMNTKVVVLGFITALVMMGLCFAPEPIGHAEAGAHRWINIGSQSFQPSELMKAVLIVFLSSMLCKNAKKLNNFKTGVLPFAVILGIVCSMMVLQRHISGMLIMAAIGMCVIFVGGMPLKNIVQLGMVLVIAGSIAIGLFSAAKGGGLSYILDRFTGMGQASEGEITDDSWQTAQSLIAIGSGGWFGLGFGESRQKYAWLPESQNDFIFPIIVEELGYLGGLVVIVLFGLFIYRGFYIAKKAHDKFGMLIVTGITFQIGIQALLNIGVACNAFPNTGISLPFFSYGGTALLMQLAEMGIILSVSRQSDW